MSNSNSPDYDTGAYMTVSTEIRRTERKISDVIEP